MQLGDLNKVWEIRALKRKPRHEEAKQILERIAKQVQPIMRKHNWRVKVLSEFWPKRRQLLGLNVGAGVEVKLRLRRSDRESEFYPFEEVLDTMLHELCHNAHGPHNTSFYQLWDQLRKECEELMSRGISGTGEGFDLPGKRLGGFSHQPPLSSLHKTVLTAAENRLRLNSLLPTGPLRLGGDKNIMTALSPIQAAAMAAERRLQDDIWCASASGGLDVEDESGSDPSETVSLVDRTAVSTVGAGDGKRTRASNDSSTLGSCRSSSAKLTNMTNNVNLDHSNIHDVASNKRSRLSSASSSLPVTDACVESNLVDSSMGVSTSRSTVNGSERLGKRSHDSNGSSSLDSYRSSSTKLTDITNNVNPKRGNIHDVASNKRTRLSSASSSLPDADACLKHNLVDSSMGVSTSGLTVNGSADNYCCGESVMWTCNTCTLLNPPLALVCEACETLKPKDESMKYKFWSCSFCTLENSISFEKCSACDQWRYSHGPPSSTRPPYLGT